MHIQVYHAVNQALSQTFTAMETDKERDYLIGPEVRSFISNFVFESLLFRSNEWQAGELNPDEEAAAERIATVVGDSVTAVLPAQATGDTERIGQQRLLLIDVVQNIHANWCQVFPFCR